MIHLVSFFSSNNMKEGGEGTDFLKRLQEIEHNEQQHDDFNEEVERFPCVSYMYYMNCTYTCRVMCIIHCLYHICVLNLFTLKRNYFQEKFVCLRILVSASIKTTKSW
jgi:hypothetical protein